MGGQDGEEEWCSAQKKADVILVHKKKEFYGKSSRDSKNCHRLWTRERVKVQGSMFCQLNLRLKE